MNTSILSSKIQAFISDNLKTDTTALLLKKNVVDTVPTKEIITQIEAKNKCEKKLPTWFNTKYIYYPNKLNIEQTSSETTAQYKAQLVSGTTLLDITGGFGVDSYYFSKQFKTVIHCEINSVLSRIAQHNFQQLNAKNISCNNKSGITYLEHTTTKIDCIYVDPSRRDAQKSRVFFLKDCLPNVPEYLELFFKHATTVLLKTSPLLDISSGINDLESVKTIHCIAVNNDVKELIWELEKGYNAPIEIKTINFKKNANQLFSFFLNTEETLVTTFSQPLEYLYEPNAAIMKSGGFSSVSKQLNVSKLHPNSQLYTSSNLVHFPGRIFKIVQILPFNKKQLKKALPKKANVTTRNFPNTVAQLRKTFNIKDGGNDYLFFTTNSANEKIVLICIKIT